MLFDAKISAAYSGLTYSQRKVANYVQEKYEDVAFETLEKLAAKAGVSTTTVIRFSRALGDTFTTDINNLNQTFAGLQPDELEAAIRLISGAKNIYVLGMRSSFSLAHYMVSRLGEIKKNVHFVQLTGLIYPEEIVSADVGDVCIAYIFPRYSKTGINILAWMRSRGVKIVLITSNNNLPVRSYGDICFRCAIQSVSCKNSLTAPMCLTNYLVAELALRNYDEAHEVLSRTEEILSTGFYLGI